MYTNAGIKQSSAVKTDSQILVFLSHINTETLQQKKLFTW